ncbi:MAG: alpha/beta hydrolase [Sedimentisphaerales bacterium]|jgi:acetyl esterase/lipase|nr:alpha/beta hydrolase [Sedimentisphaerales bacterium]
MSMVAAIAVLALVGRAWPTAVVEPLWPGTPPGAKADQELDRPSITFYSPEPNQTTGTAVVIFPGGGYTHLATDHEGQQVAAWLTKIGVLAAVVRYRHNGNGYKYPVPLWDGQRAIRLVRYKAGSLGVRPDRIGLMGFSAGGHLASTVATHPGQNDLDSTDPIDQVSSRPDFLVLVYPVITLYPPYCHMGSRQNLLGDAPDQRLIELLSNERQVTADTPVTFLVHGDGDKAVPVENSLLFYQALRKAGVRAEIHIFRESRHGFGLGGPGGAVALWPVLCQEWMKALGLLRSEAGQ